MKKFLVIALSALSFASANAQISGVIRGVTDQTATAQKPGVLVNSDGSLVVGGASGGAVQVQGSVNDGSPAAKSIVIAGKDGAGNVSTPLAAAGIGDGTSNSVGNLFVRSFNSLYNGTTWDRQYSNRDTGAFINAVAATTTQTSSDLINFNGRCIKVVLNMATVGTGSVTLTLQGKDTASNAYYTILSGAAVTTNSTNVYSVCPGITATANVSANDILPRTWRVVVTANNANATTYTVGASIIN